MKKLFFAIAFLIVAMGVQAQDYTKKINLGESYVWANTSTTVTNADTSYVDVNVRCNYPFTFSAGMNVDIVSGSTTTDSLYVQGRIDDGEAWVTIAKQVWSGTTNTNVILTHGTAVRYRHVRLFYKGMGTCVRTLDNAWLKIWYE